MRRPQLILLTLTALSCLLTPANTAAQLGRAQLDSSSVLNKKSAGETAAKLRVDYFNEDYEPAALKGKSLVAQSPDALEAQAWYILSLAESDLFYGDAPKKAVSAADQMLATNPQSPWSFFALAGALAKDRAFERKSESLEVSETALAKMPTHPDFIWLRAEVLLANNKIGEALSFCEANRASFQKSAELLATKAKIVFASGAKDKAMQDAAFALFDEARRVDAANLSAYHQAARHLFRAKRAAEAYPLLKLAVSLAPGSTSVHMDYWDAVKVATGLTAAQKRTELIADGGNLHERRSTLPGALYAVSQLYGVLELGEKQKEIEDRLLQQYRESSAAEVLLLDRIKRFSAKVGVIALKAGENQAIYRRMLWEIVRRPRHYSEWALTRAYQRLLISYKDDPSVTTEQVLEVIREMSKLRRTGTRYRAHAARALADRHSHLREAEELTRSGIDGVIADLNRRVNDAVTTNDYRQAFDALGSSVAPLYDALGWIYYNENRLNEAEKSLLLANALTPHDVYNLYHLGRLYEARKDRKKAEEYYARGLEQDQQLATMRVIGETLEIENPSLMALKEMYKRQHGNLKRASAYDARVRGINLDKKRTKVLATRIAEPEVVPSFTLKTLSGSEISSVQLRGKIVVIKHWGVWCPWCVAEMPEFQKLVEKYKNDAEVVILTLDKLDTVEKVQHFMREKNYSFEVMLDDGYAERAGVEAYPTTWFIDREGGRAFIKRGFTHDLLEEFSWRIEELRGRTAVTVTTKGGSR